MSDTAQGTNPLLEGSDQLPRFGRIRAEHVEPAIQALLEELKRAFEALETSATPDWKGIVEPIERNSDGLGFAWGIVEHLMAVQNYPELRAAYEKVEPKVVELTTTIGQSRPIYDSLTALRDSDTFAKLDPTQRRIVSKLIQQAELAGVGLEDADRKRFQEIKLELASLSTQFGNHLLDSTKAFGLVLTEPEEVDGLPPSFLEMAAQSARSAGTEQAKPESGPWRITLDGPSYIGFMKYSSRRDLREKLYLAFITRASTGEFSNVDSLGKILALRQEMASLLGFDSYAELSLSRKMAATVDKAEELLEELREVAFAAAQSDLVALKDFIVSQGGSEIAGQLKPWDVAYWSEKLRESTFDLNEEALRPYFPLPHVLEGLFRLANRLFGIQVVSADGEEPVWHEDVRFFRVLTDNGKPIAAFYLDPYSRPAEKRGGAWMNEVVGRSQLFGRDGHPRLPVAYLICNGTQPVDGNPSLMTFREIETLFHEFGHTLQHMLTRVDYGLASGIRNVEWDAVELPSQFMENWCYHRETLIGLSRHVDTGEPLPDAMFDRITAAHTFRSGTDMLRQLHFASVDLELHHRYRASSRESVFDVQRRVAKTTTVIPPIPEDRFLCGFSHIFQGGYAAGYYSYKWAEVLSADAFAAFEEAGLENDEALVETGRRFRETVLALGGSQPPIEVFKSFRGREPSTLALLRHAGLSP